MDPPAMIRRFTRVQIVQHWAATGFGAALLVSASLPGEYLGMTQIHSDIGLVCAVFLFLHFVMLIAIGIRHDVSPEKVAFFPTGWEWSVFCGRPIPSPQTGKYAPNEKGDYLAILFWSVLLVVSGIFLRWPGTLGVPGPGAYGWLRVIHAGCGAALSIHVLLVHIPGRWFRPSRAFRRAMITGMIPLEEAETRPGWVADLEAEGILIPIPREVTSESAQESDQVRNLLEKGNRLVQEEKFGEAARHFEQALNLFPGYSQARFNLGIARWKEGKPDLAVEQFRLFIDMDPFNPMAERARDMLDSIARGKNRRDQ
jgi:hypothetical protein